MAQSEPNGEALSDLDGEWDSKIRAPSPCPMPGFFTDVQTFEISQDGDTISASFDDTAGNQVTLAGTYVDGTLEGTFTVTSPDDRVVVADALMYGSFGEDDIPVLDGDTTVTQDTDDLCVGAVVVIWMLQSPPEDEPDPEPLEPLIVFAGHGHTEGVDVVDLDTMTLINTIEGAGGYRMAILPDGTKLYGTTGDNTFTVSDAIGISLSLTIDPSELLPQLETNELEPITASRNGDFVYVADEMGNHGVFTVRTSDDMVIDGAVLTDAYEPESAITSPDDQFLYIVDSDRAMKISTVTLEIVDSAPVDGDAHGVTLSLDGAYLYAESASQEDRGIDVIQTSDMTVFMNIPGAEGYALKTSPDGAWVYGVDESRTLYVIDTSDHSMVSVNLDDLGLPTSIFGARGLATTPDSKFVIICSRSGLIKLDAVTLMPVGFLEGSYQSAVVRPPVGTLEPTNR